MMVFPLLALLVQVEAAPPPPADTVSLLRRAARHAETAFERIVRQRAPITFASFGRNCDEIVGRFCLTYDAGELPAPAPEVPEVIRARRDAIEALRRAFAYAPAELDVTGPLVRYLVEDERSEEAVSAARAFMMLSPDTTWGALLLGFALHAAGNDTAASRLLDYGVSRLPDREQRHITDISWLLAYDEQRIYRRLEGEDRARYDREFWTLADPLYLLPGEERRNEHIARHVWSRILSRTPVVAGSFRWGRDLEQLTVRYGMPTSRLRAIGGPGTPPGRESMVERWENSLAYAPEQLRRSGFDEPPLPGEKWPLANPRARSGFRSYLIRELVPLDHQVSRFPAFDSVVVRVDAVFPLDSAAAGAARVQAGLFLLDSLNELTSRETRWVDVRGDTARLRFLGRVGGGRFVYSAEAYEVESRFAARARYVLEAHRTTGLTISDLVVAEPFGSDSLPSDHTDPLLRPLGSLVVPAGNSIGLYAEVTGLATAADGRTRYRVEVTRSSAERASLPGAIVGWIGRRIGIGPRTGDPRAAWSAQSDPTRPTAIALDLGLEGVRPGLYAFEIVVTDLVTGATQEAGRVVRVR